MNEYRNKFDAIIVGAGPAGITAGYVLSKAGADVVIFERGEYPGAKNMFGGVLYSRILNDLIPGFWEEAPVERYITRRTITVLSQEASFSIDFKSQDFGLPIYNAFSILRSKFDKWYAEKAQKSGALIIPETIVDDILWENDRVRGVRVRRDSGEVFSDVVIIADGANSLLSKKAGMRSDYNPRYFSIGVKEIISLPNRVIEERFNLRGNEGIDHEFVGFCTRGIKGGGFLYTNQSSLSIGLVVDISAIRDSNIQLWRLLEDFKQLSPIRELIKDGMPKEYSAHLVPIAGARMMPNLYSNGILIVGDAAGLVYNTGLSLEGANFAIASGIAAADTVKHASNKGEFSKNVLAEYETRLNDSFVLKDLKSRRRAFDILSNPRLYNMYPKIVTELFQNIYAVDTKPRKMLWKLSRDILRSNKSSLFQITKDLFKVGRSI